MIRITIGGFLLVGLFLVSVRDGFRAQETPQEISEEPFVLREQVGLVIVPVTAKDRAGNLVDNLTQDNFQVFEDGKEREIRFFSTEIRPLSAVILLDGELPQKYMQMVERTLASLSNSFEPNDERALYMFDRTVRRVQPFTQDAEILFRATLEKFPKGKRPGIMGPPLAGVSTIGGQPIDPTQGIRFPGKTPGRRIHDAMFAAARELRSRSQSRRRMVLILSDGKNATDNRLNYEDALNALVRADVSVYAIHFNKRWVWKRFDVLSRYARETGGDIFTATRLRTLDPLYARITDQVRGQYVLGFSPAASDGELHSIRVQVDRPQTKLLARNSYFSPATER